MTKGCPLGAVASNLPRKVVTFPWSAAHSSVILSILRYNTALDGTKERSVASFCPKRSEFVKCIIFKLTQPNLSGTVVFFFSTMQCFKPLGNCAPLSVTRFPKRSHGVNESACFGFLDDFSNLCLKCFHCYLLSLSLLTHTRTLAQTHAHYFSHLWIFSHPHRRECMHKRTHRHALSLSFSFISKA